MVRDMKRITVFLTGLLLVLPCMGKGGSASYDVVVAGAGCGGYSAAVQAARQGCRVLLIEESDYLGGQMAAAGVGTMDEGTVRIRQNGIYKEFCDRVSEYYKSQGLVNNVCYWSVTSFSVEPHVAQQVIYDMIDDVNKAGKGHIDLMLLTKVTKVLKDGNRVTGVDLESGVSKKTARTVNCRILIDATEYGDVIPLTGARYMIAKHTSESIDRQSNVQCNTWTVILKEYKDGVPEFLKVKEKPKNYNQYEWRNKWIQRYASDTYSVYANPTSWYSIAYYRGMPDSSHPGLIPDLITKTELNIAQNDVPVRVNDCISEQARFAKEFELRNKTLSLLYYLQNDLGLPWSVDPAEGYDTPYNRAQIDRIVEVDPSYTVFKPVLYHFPVLPYVRESFRIIGQHVLISSEIDREKGPVTFPDAVSLNDYPEDLHGSHKPEDMDAELDPEAVAKAGVIKDWNAHCGEFQVPLRSFIPESLDGFLVAEKNLSQSRLVNGATRLQPSTMINGQAAGNIAALAVKRNCQPRDLPVLLVQWEQVKAKSPLWFKPVYDVQVQTQLWNYVQIALIKGYFKLYPGARFIPQMIVSGDELSALIEKCGLEGIVSPDAEITRADLVKIIIDKELKAVAL